MAKYDTHIKPFLNEIKEMVKLGATQKDIYIKLKVSRNVWYKSKDAEKDLRDILEDKGHIKERVDNSIEILANIPTIKMFKEKIADKGYYDEDVGLATILQAFRQLYPNENQFLQRQLQELALKEKIHNDNLALEKEKLELEKLKVEKGINSNQPIVIIKSDIERGN